MALGLGCRAKGMGGEGVEVKRERESPMVRHWVGVLGKLVWAEGVTEVIDDHSLILINTLTLINTHHLINFSWSLC